VPLVRFRPQFVIVALLFTGVHIIFAAPVQDAAAAQEHAERGRQLIGRGELAPAERELRKAVELAPGSAEFLGLLGVVLGMQQKLQESDLYLEKALRLDPADSAMRRNLAWNQFELGQLAPAKINLDRVLKENPRDAVATLLMGMIEEERKQYEAAVKLLESVPEQVRERPESVAALARAYYYTGRRQKSREVLKQLQQQSAEPKRIFVAGQVAAEIREFDVAEALFQSLSASYADRAELSYALARVQYRAGQFSESLETLRRAVAAGYETSEIYNLLGWCLYKKEDAKAAVAALDKAIALDPADESNYLDAGIILLQSHYFNIAAIAAEKALAVAPDSYRAHRLKAQIELRSGRVNDAEAHYARAVELNPADAEAIIGLATAQLDIGKAAAAETTLKTAIERLPREAVLYQAYGTMLLWGDARSNSEVEARAAQLLQKAEALDPTLPDAHYELGKLALRDGNTREALRQLETAVKLDPQSAKNHYGLAQAYRKLGRSAEAGREAQLFQEIKAKENRAFPKPTESAK
jgi:Flp pilus assembly protein TadD